VGSDGKPNLKVGDLLGLVMGTLDIPPVGWLDAKGLVGTLGVVVQSGLTLGSSEGYSSGKANVGGNEGC